MYLYKKTIKPKNTAGKITSLLCLLCGAALFILASGNYIMFPSIAQVAGVILIGIAIYVASAYLLREYTFSVTQSEKFDSEDASYAEKFDFIITEKKNNRDIKVCHFGMNDVTGVRAVDPENKKQVQEERKDMKRFTYNTEYAAARYIELQASLDDEQYSILVSYDEDLLRVLNGFFE
ncbi:MAG: hypothetical protein IJY39_10770 [Clostridia bacterium]|nr:hypothetical protein [Clostridia bacterium]